jgi:hypothetical protein
LRHPIENEHVKDGGRGGIRTHVRVSPKPDFESGAFNHSATLPLANYQVLTTKTKKGTDILTRLFYTAHMNKSEGQSNWAQIKPYLVRYVPSGTIYARFRASGKLIQKSLKTDRVSVAELRLEPVLNFLLK